MFPVFSHLYFFQLHPEQLLCQRRQNLLQLLHVLLHHRVRVDPGHDAKAMATFWPGFTVQLKSWMMVLSGV